MSIKTRVAVASLSLSAAALVALFGEEGYTDKAVIPVKGDVPTYGFGMTQRPDGTPVRMGDTTTPVEAAKRTLAYTQKVDANIRKCVTAPLYQGEYDIMSNFSYQYGVDRLCGSTIVKLANAGDYAGSCRAYLDWKKAGGFDCSTPGNKVCPGVWERSQKRHAECMALQ